MRMYDIKDEPFDFRGGGGLAGMEDFSLARNFSNDKQRRHFSVSKQCTIDIYLVIMIFFPCLEDCRNFLFHVFQPFPQTSNGSPLIARCYFT